jgi:hypothetical protein
VGAESGCLDVYLDGEPFGPVCSSRSFQVISLGTRVLTVREPVTGDTIDGPIALSFAAGDTVVRNADLSTHFGLLTGKLIVDGQPPNGGHFAVCFPTVCDRTFGTDGTFLVTVPAGTGTGMVRDSGTVVGTFTYTGLAGQTVDVGNVSVAAVIRPPTAELKVVLLYKGDPLPGQAGKRSNCFDVRLDGQVIGGACGTTQINRLTPGTRTYTLTTVNGGTGATEIVAGPIPITLVNGQTTVQTTEVASHVGFVTGKVLVNGGAPRPGIDYYYVCAIDGCNFSLGADGSFSVWTHAGSGSGEVHHGGSFATVKTFGYTAVAGQTADIGGVNLQLGAATLEVNLSYHGQPLSQTGADACSFEVRLDDNRVGGLCGSATFQALESGTRAFKLVANDDRIGGYRTLVGPTPLVLTGGQTTVHNVDVSGSMAMLTGRITINGQPPTERYLVCASNGCDSSLNPDGTFLLFAHPGSGTGQVKNGRTFAVLRTFGYNAVAGQTTLVGTVEGGASGYTPTGTGITVKPVDPATSTTPVTLQFTAVTAAGNSQVRSGRSGPTPPGGTRPGNPATYYDIETTATFSGSILVCINYNDDAYGNEDRLKLYHADASGAWTDVTTSRDATTNVVCGTVSSLSPFLIAETNAAPVVESLVIQNGVVPVGSDVSVRVSFSDANPLDRHTALLVWDDGTSSAGALTEADGRGTVTGSHTYAAAGVYTVGVRVSDDPLVGERSSTSDLPAYAVVYDPSAGFVTGGGWIASPAGACRFSACTTGTTGRASFGFVARYRPGATAPTGNTEFQFRAGGVDFKSDSYEWLVVAGARAQFKGYGQINGRGEYGFLLTALDGALLRAGGADRFRIKIWDRNTGAVVYDNQMAEAEDNDASTELGGGSIVIHR